MYFRTEKTAWGFRIAKVDGNKTSYVKAIKQDGTYLFHDDYLYARMFGEKAARKHLAILNGGKA